MTNEELWLWLTADLDEIIDMAGETEGKEADNVNKALEKQIPKKPNETEAYPHRLYCPNCYFTFCFNKDNLDGIKALRMYNYCPDCGQAIDWSDVNDKL